VRRDADSGRTRPHQLVLKGLSDITTPASDKAAAHSGHDLFSHPHTDDVSPGNDPSERHPVPAKNLFSERADQDNGTHPVPRDRRPPRDPFGQSPPEDSSTE
jgi:hypothetical protein